jgi:hypothetical protein
MMTFGSNGWHIPESTWSRSPGPSFEAQPALLTVWVSLGFFSMFPLLPDGSATGGNFLPPALRLPDTYF